MHSTNGPLPKARTIAWLLASVAFLAGLEAAQAGTIEDTVRAALAANPDVGVVKADRRAVDQELRQARGGLLPSIDFRADAGPEYSDNPTTRSFNDNGGSGHRTELRREAQVKLSQLLYDGGQAQSEIERQSARVSSASYRVEESGEFIGVNAIESHLDVLRNQEIVKLNDANVAAHTRILGQVRQLERSGGGDIVDVRQTEARISAAEATLALSKGDLADSIANYQRRVGERPEGLVLEQPPLKALPASADAAAIDASSYSPTVKIAASDVDAAAAELRGTRANYMPQFNAELNGFAGEDLDGERGSNVSANALLVMHYNLYRGGADLAREREAFHRTNEARFALERARQNAEQQARVSYNALETARARTVALRSRAEAQRRTRDAYASQFEIGQRSLLDVLDAENELFVARVALITAEYVQRFAVYRVLAVTGRLLQTLEVPLPREQSDIYRTPADLQTPEAIEARTPQLVDPRSEPRPLRGLDAGEAPADALDLSVAPPAPAGSAMPASATPESTTPAPATGAPKPMG
jgi:adhesin transport system outer membrane protein